MAQYLTGCPVAGSPARLGPVGQADHHVDPEHGGRLGEGEEGVDVRDRTASDRSGCGLVEDDGPAITVAVGPGHPGRWGIGGRRRHASGENE
jgi:hypothetical protein